MDKLVLKNVKQLHCRGVPIYYTVKKLGEIKRWENSQKFWDPSKNVVTIVTKNIKVIKENCIEVFDPVMVAPPLKGKNESEWVVLILIATTPYIILQVLSKQDVMGSLIEFKKSVSKNSTRLITYNSLVDIVNELFNNVPLNKAIQLSYALRGYIKELKSNYKYLDYLSISKRKEFQSRSVADKKIGWYIYLKYFLEQWDAKQDIKIPPLNKNFHFGKWSGQFFLRENPLWDYIYKEEKRQHNPSKQQRERIYEKWKSFIKES